MKTFLFHSQVPHLVIKVGISACLLGYPVRYDGKKKALPQLQEHKNINIQWQPICPEITLGIPRPPVQLVQISAGSNNHDIQAIGVEDTSLNVTQNLISNSHNILSSTAQEHSINHSIEKLEGLASDKSTNTSQGLNSELNHSLKDHIDIWLLKARSPSCGSNTTPLHSAKNEVIAFTDGLFVQACREKTPLCAIFDETVLDTKMTQSQFYLCALITQDIKKTQKADIPELVEHYKKKGLLDKKIETADKTNLCELLHRKIIMCSEAKLNQVLENLGE